MHTLLRLLLCAVLLSAQSSQAQWLVFDEQAGVQRALLWAQEAIQWADSIQKQVEHIQATYNVILNQIKAYETFIRNLQRMPEGLNVLETVKAYGAKLTGILRQANAIGYDADSVTAQFEALYTDIGPVAMGDLTRVRERFLGARMQSSQIAVQVQAIQAHASSIVERLCALLDGVHTVQGNLDSHQIAAQQQALQTTTLQQMQALQATAHRLQAQREAEEVALERIRIQVIETFTTPVPEYTGTQGFLPTYRWTDQH